MANNTMTHVEFIKALETNNVFIGASINKKSGKPQSFVVIDNPDSDTGRSFLGRSRIIVEKDGARTEKWEWTVGKDAQARQ